MGLLKFSLINSHNFNYLFVITYKKLEIVNYQLKIDFQKSFLGNLHLPQLLIFDRVDFKVQIILQGHTPLRQLTYLVLFIINRKYGLHKNYEEA
jgi:hypothetical protein